MRDAVRQRRPLDQFHDEGLDALRLFEAMDLRDVRVVQGGERLGLALEAGDPFGISGERRRQDLDRDITIRFVSRAR